jgi:hypothetical protein
MSGLPPNRAPDAIATPVENFTTDDDSARAIIDYYQLVMGDYFDTMGIPIVAGRGFEPRDNTSHNKVAIVNETLASGSGRIGIPSASVCVRRVARSAALQMNAGTP